MGDSGRSQTASAAATPPGSAGEAVALLESALDHLNRADVASLGAAAQADLLRALERAAAKHTAARVNVLAAFTAGRGFDDDGQHSARAWLIWQTRVTCGAAAGAVAWMKRVRAHPAIWEALAEGTISPSWGREICSWTDRLPDERRDDADRILLAAAAGGALLPDLASLAWQMYQCSLGPDADPEAAFADRGLHLGETFGRTGRLEGDLTAAATAVVRTVLDSLAAKTGPEDVRTSAQRNHDALEEACLRLISSGMLPQRAGQPVHLQLQITLDQLRGTSSAESSWAAAQSTGLTSAEVEALSCDATILPTVTGHIDHQALDHLVHVFLDPHVSLDPHANVWQGQPVVEPTFGSVDGRRSGWLSLPPHLRGSLLAMAVDVLSGPGGLAAALRTAQAGQIFTTTSLPLDVGAAIETIPGHLRRAVILRDQHCRFPGCSQPPDACQVHHLIHRRDGGPTALPNLMLLCRFHHLIVVHRWGWTITLHPDGTTTATSPSGRTLHSHGPPARAA